MRAAVVGVPACRAARGGVGDCQSRRVATAVNRTPTERQPTVDSKHVDSKHVDVDSEHVDSKHVDNEHVDNEHVDSEHSDSKHVGSEYVPATLAVDSQSIRSSVDAVRLQLRLAVGWHCGCRLIC